MMSDVSHVWSVQLALERPQAKRPRASQLDGGHCAIRALVWPTFPSNRVLSEDVSPR